MPNSRACPPRGIRWPAVVLIASTVMCVAVHASAQGAGADATPSTDLLLRRLEDLERSTRAEIEKLRAEVLQQAQELERLRPGAQTATTPPDAPGPSPAPERAVVAATAIHDTFGRERETVARVDNVATDPALAGFFSIPNTPARMKIDGYAKLDAMFDARPAGNTDLFNVGSIPIALTPSEQVANTNIHARQTRVQLDFRSPTSLDAEFRAFAEIDFFGSSGPVDPRLRHFYGQLGNVLLGQTWTTFTDVDAFPDVLDLAGPAGVSLARQPQMRYTHPLARGQSLAFGIEKADVQAPQLAGSGRAYTPAPDVVVRYRFERSHGHMQLGSVSRVLGYRTATANRKQYGYAVNASGGVRVVGDDTILGYVMGGRGAGRYVDNISGLGADLDVNDDGTDVAALPVFGTYLGYTHRWPARLRSTAVFGYSSIDNTEAQAATAYRRGYYVAGNLIFTASGSLNVGVEYLFGSHEQRDGQRGTATRVQVAAKYDLYRKRPVDQK